MSFGFNILRAYFALGEWPTLFLRICILSQLYIAQFSLVSPREKGILWKPPSHEQAGTRLVKKAQMHLTGPSITVFKDPLAGAAQLGHKQAEGQRGSEALSTA